MAIEHRIPEMSFENIDDTDPFTPEELAYYKATLLAKREEIAEKTMQHLKEAVGDAETPADEVDLAAKISDQAFLMRLADKERKLLNLIDRALHKFDTGEYGYCEGTGEQIARKRLALRPWTRYSVVHKELLERQRGRRHRR